MRIHRVVFLAALSAFAAGVNELPIRPTAETESMSNDVDDPATEFLKGRRRDRSVGRGSLPCQGDDSGRKLIEPRVQANERGCLRATNRGVQAFNVVRHGRRIVSAAARTDKRGRVGCQLFAVCGEWNSTARRSIQRRRIA